MAAAFASFLSMESMERSPHSAAPSPGTRSELPNAGAAAPNYPFPLPCTSSSSAFFDLQLVYGASTDEGRAVRTQTDGRLQEDAVTPATLRAVRCAPTAEVGAGVLALAQLFNRNHNFLALRIKSENSGAKMRTGTFDARSDENVFQVYEGPVMIGCIWSKVDDPPTPTDFYTFRTTTHTFGRLRARQTSCACVRWCWASGCR